MQQPQSRPLLGDSVSSTTSPTTRRNNNPVAVLTQQQLQQLQQLQSQNSSQPVTFTLQQSSSGNQEQNNGSTTGNHILYVNQLNQLNQSPINSSGTGMGLPQATPTFGVGLNVGLPLSLLNTGLSNAITSSSPLLNLNIPNINSGLTTINPNLNQLGTLSTNLNSSLPSDSISNGLSNLGQELNNINSGINRLGTLNTTSISSGLTNIGTGLTNVNPNLSSLNTSAINQNLATINTNLSTPNTGASPLNTINPNLNLSTNNVNSALNQQGLNRSLNAITNFNSTSSNAQFPFQTIQSIQSIAPHLTGCNISNVVSSAISQNQSSNITSSVQSSNTGSTSCVSSTFTSTGPILATTTNTAQSSNNNQQINVAQFGIMNTNMTNVLPQTSTNESNSNSTLNQGFQRQFSNQNLNQQANTSPVSNSIISNIKTMQGIQNQNNSSPSSPFSIPMKSPASNIAPPTPSPSPNRIHLRSPASNSVQSRNSPSPVSSASNSNFIIQSQSPMQSPIGVGQIQSPIPSPYPPAKSPHPLNNGSNLNNKSPAPGGSPGPPVVRPNTPILQQGMQVLQIIHNTPQGYQQTPRLVTQTHFLGNQQIQIATPNKPNKQPPQILPKPPLQGATVGQQKPRSTTTITNQVTQQSQPQLVLAGPQQNTPTVIPTAQGLLLNQVLPSTGPVIVQQQPGGVQLILRTPANAQQQTHTAQLTQQQLVRVVTAQGMQLQGITPTFFAVPNGFSSATTQCIRHTPSSPAPPTSASNGSIVIQNAMVQNQQPQMTQTSTINNSGNIQNSQTLMEQNLLPPPKKKAKKKKKPKKKDEESPKFDLGSLIKLSGIDDDDIFDNDLTMETESVSTTPVQSQTQPQAQTQPQSQSQAQPQPQLQPQQQTQTQTQNQTQTQTQTPTQTQTQSQLQPDLSSAQNTPFGTVSNASGQQNIAQLAGSSTSNLQLQTNSTQETSNQPTTQSPISGQFRLSVSEDGRILLHHTPEPNQSEMDSATAQALIRSLTQGGQNSQIISQLLQTQQSVQSQNAVNNRQKLDKPPVSKLNSSPSPTVLHTTTSIVNPQSIHINSNTINCQNLNISSISQNSQAVLTTPIQSSIVQPTINITSQNLNQSTKKVVVSRKVFDGKKQAMVDVKTTVCQKSNVQNPVSVGQNQIVTINQHQSSNLLQTKCNNVKSRNTSVNTNQQQQNINKQIIVQTQKPTQSSTIPQRSIQIVKNNQNKLQQMNIQDNGSFLSQNSTVFQQNLSQQISTPQILQSNNMTQVFDQNLQQNISASTQRSTADGIKIDSLNVMQNTSNNPQQSHQTVNLIQQNIGSSIQSLEQNLQFSSDIQNPQQNLLMNSSNLRQQNVKSGSVSTNNNQLVEIQNQNQNLQANILISNSSTSTQQDPPKLETQNTLFNGPKISPEILTALSNMNPNDQLLIANANGQMQVLSQQQILQQILSGQLNSQTQSQTQQVQAQSQQQNQAQKIVIGDPDSNNTNMQEVQINTPTSQIIVNSSGGAPTIQNNIQNIVVQAAPTQLPQQIQIQNSGFPSQFIDNLNQQQIRNLGNNQAINQNINQSTNQSCISKKPKLIKRTKLLAVAPQQTTVSKPICVTRPVVIATTSSTTTTTSNTVTSQHQKSEALVKPLNFFGEVLDSKKNDLSAQHNGPTIFPNCQNTSSQSKLVHKLMVSPQNMQLLASIQSQMSSINARKADSQPLSSEDQVILAKLEAEQQRIMSTARIISVSTHPIINETTNVNVNSITTTNLTSNTVTTCKGMLQNSQTPATAPNSIMVNSSNILLSTSSSAGITMSNNNSVQASSLQSVISTKQQHPAPIQSQLQPHQQLAQNQLHSEGVGQMLVPSCSSVVENFDSHQLAAPSIISMEVQQSSIQCQNESMDVKSTIIQAPTLNIKQELVSFLPITPVSSHTGVLSSNSKPILTQSKLLSPSEKNDPSASPRQGIKRSSTSSPLCRQINRSDLFEQQLKNDQNGAMNPDTSTPFESKNDACNRLLKYHCYDEQVLSTKDLEKADEIFEETAKHLLTKFNSMVNKYTYLLIMDSMRETRTSELMMIDRMIVNEEQVNLNKLREQEAKLTVEEIKIKPKMEPGMEPEPKIDLEAEDKFLVPKFETDDATMMAAVEGVKLEVEMEVKSADYDEWLEIQKELGVYAPTEMTLGSKSRSKSGRGRSNGESGTRDVIGVVSELERDLLDDAESLDGLALYAQSQFPAVTRAQSAERCGGPEENDITAQVQSAIDSILSLKKRPATSSGVGSGSGSQTSSNCEANDKLLDQAVRSILGS